jgi:type I restriction enzyme S subunit
MRILGHGHASDARSSLVRFSKGDVLYAKMRPYLNKVWVAEFDGACSAEFLVFPKRGAANNQFLAMRLSAEDFVTFANAQVSGERPRVDFEKISRFPIALPPALEQSRIVVKLDAVLPGLRRAETAARRACERLGRYRAAVLDAGVIGEVTRGWREARPEATTAAGQTSLQQLRAARRLAWERSEFGRPTKAGIGPQDRRRPRYSDPARLGTPPRADMPSSWAWARLEELSLIIGGLTKNPRREGLRLKLPYLRVANVYADGSERESDRLATVMQLSSPAEPRGTRR